MAESDIIVVCPWCHHAVKERRRLDWSLQGFEGVWRLYQCNRCRVVISVDDATHWEVGGE